ncbi:MAG: hypothetical protein JWM63_5241 [Gammaproteobacteria bacterium]|jgi:hypothetical protein|nr:hypothetical protein [Gammaproteobacteria bacterium]
MNARNRFDPWSLLVILFTLALFLIALFTKGITHDLLLEAGVFLVSVKLILMGYKNSASNDSIQQKLDEIRSAVQQLGLTHGPDSVMQSTGSRSDARPASGPPGG